MNHDWIPKLWDIFRPYLPVTLTGGVSLLVALYGALSGVSPWDLFLMVIAILGLLHLWIPRLLPASTTTSKLRDYLMSQVDPASGSPIFPTPETLKAAAPNEDALEDPRRLLKAQVQAIFEADWTPDSPQFAQESGESQALKELMIALCGDINLKSEGLSPWTLGDVSLLIRMIGTRPWKDPLLLQYLQWGDIDSATRTWLARAAGRYEVPKGILLPRYERLLKDRALPPPENDEETKADAILLRLPGWRPEGAEAPVLLGQRLWEKGWLDPTETAMERVLRRLSVLSRPFRYWSQWRKESWRLIWQPASRGYIVYYTLLSLFLGISGVLLTFQGSNLTVGPEGQRPIAQARGSAYNPIFAAFGQPRDTGLFEDDFAEGDTPIEWDTTTSFTHHAPTGSPTSDLPLWFASMIGFEVPPSNRDALTLALDQTRAVEGRRVGWSVHPRWCRFMDFDITGWSQGFSVQQKLALRLTPEAAQWACVGRNADWWQALEWAPGDGSLQGSRASTLRLLEWIQGISAALGVGLEDPKTTPKTLAIALAVDIADAIIPRESTRAPEVASLYTWAQAQALIRPLPPGAPLRQQLTRTLGGRVQALFVELCADVPLGYAPLSCGSLQGKARDQGGLIPWAIATSVDDTLPDNQRRFARRFLGVIAPVIGFLSQNPTSAPPELGDLSKQETLVMDTLTQALGTPRQAPPPAQTPSERIRWIEALFQCLLAQSSPLAPGWSEEIARWPQSEAPGSLAQDHIAWLSGALLILRQGEGAIAQSLPAPKTTGTPLALSLLAGHPRLQDAYFGAGATPLALESEGSEPPWGAWSAKRWARWVRINAVGWNTKAIGWRTLDVWELDIFARWLLRHPETLATTLEGERLPDALDWVSLAGQPRGLVREIPNRVEVLQRFARGMARGLGYWHHLRRSAPRDAEDQLWEKIQSLEEIYQEDAEELGPNFAAPLVGGPKAATKTSPGSEDVLVRRLARRDLMARTVGEMLATFVAPSEGWTLDPEATLNRWIQDRLGGPAHSQRAQAFTIAVTLLHQRGFGPYALNLPQDSQDPALEAMTYGIRDPLFPTLYYHLADPTQPISLPSPP